MWENGQRALDARGIDHILAFGMITAQATLSGSSEKDDSWTDLQTARFALGSFAYLTYMKNVLNLFDARAWGALIPSGNDDVLFRIGVNADWRLQWHAYGKGNVDAREELISKRLQALGPFFEVRDRVPYPILTVDQVQKTLMAAYMKEDAAEDVAKYAVAAQSLPIDLATKYTVAEIRNKLTNILVNSNYDSRPKGAKKDVSEQLAPEIEQEFDALTRREQEILNDLLTEQIMDKNSWSGKGDTAQIMSEACKGLFGVDISQVTTRTIPVDRIVGNIVGGVPPRKAISNETIVRGVGTRTVPVTVPLPPAKDLTTAAQRNMAQIYERISTEVRKDANFTEKWGAKAVARQALGIVMGVLDAINSVVDLVLAIRSLVLAIRNKDLNGLVTQGVTIPMTIIGIVVGITEMVAGTIPVIGVLIAFFSAIILTLVSLFVKPKQKTIARNEGIKFLESYKDYLVPDWRARFDQLIKQI
jgi:hypothetical protein